MLRADHGNGSGGCRGGALRVCGVSALVLSVEVSHLATGVGGQIRRQEEERRRRCRGKAGGGEEAEMSREGRDPGIVILLSLKST
jgi:hypothetical protein